MSLRQEVLLPDCVTVSSVSLYLVGCVTAPGCVIISPTLCLSHCTRLCVRLSLNQTVSLFHAAAVLVMSVESGMLHEKELIRRQLEAGVGCASCQRGGEHGAVCDDEQTAGCEWHLILSMTQ